MIFEIPYSIVPKQTSDLSGEKMYFDHISESELTFRNSLEIFELMASKGGIDDLEPTHIAVWENSGIDVNILQNIDVSEKFLSETTTLIHSNDVVDLRHRLEVLSKYGYLEREGDNVFAITQKLKEALNHLALTE